MLTGVCNQCGLCCMDGVNKCRNLEISIIGTTRCRVYHERFDGMPIMIESPNGTIVRLGWCGKGSIYEERAVIEKGIGRGCSLRVV